MTRKSFLTTLIAAVPALALGLYGADQSEAQTITAATPEQPAAQPKVDGHGPKAPSKRGWGPLKIETYVNMELRPEVHGYATMEFVKADRTVDVFKVRQRLDMSTEHVEPTIPERVPEGAASAKTLRELKGAQPKIPISGTNVYHVVYTDVKRVLSTGHEVEVCDFDVSIFIPRNDINVFGPLERIDRIILSPPEVTIAWRERVYMGSTQ